MTCARPVRTRRGMKPCGRQAVAVYALAEPVPLCRRHDSEEAHRFAEERGIRVEGVAT